MKQMFGVECKWMAKYIKYFVLILVLLQLPLLLMGLLGVSRSTFTQVFSILEILGAYMLIPFNIGILVRYFRTHVGRQAAFYMTLPISPMRVYWSQILAWGLAFLGVLLLQIVLAALVFSSQFGFGWLDQFWQEIPDHRWMLLAFGYLIYMLLMSFLGWSVLAAILQVYGDDRWIRFGVGGPIVAGILFYILGFVLSILILGAVAFYAFHAYMQDPNLVQLSEAQLAERIGLRALQLGLLLISVISFIQVGIATLLLSNSHKKHLQV